MSGRISEEFWTRKSQEWEAELQATEAERTRLQLPQAPATATVEKILELAKQAEFLYKSQNPTEQRRLLETVLSNCTFDSGTLYPTYSKPFDLFVRGNETGEWRRERDSNPRNGFPFSGFQDHRHRPLGHPSARPILFGNSRRRAVTAPSPRFRGR